MALSSFMKKKAYWGKGLLVSCLLCLLNKAVKTAILLIFGLDLLTFSGFGSESALWEVNFQ